MPVQGHSTKQSPQEDWRWQWEHFHNDSTLMFREWIAPNRLDDFAGKDVLDAGCDGGQHLAMIAPYAAHATGIDLNSDAAARHNTAQFSNVEVFQDDIATMDLHKQFDIVYCVGVIQHTDDPDRVFANLLKHCKRGGKVIIWAYAYEGNFLVRTLVEGSKTAVLLRLPKPILRAIAFSITAALYVPIYTLYLLPLPSLPFYEYFRQWRTFTFERNMLNVFDKLNAPTTHFFKRAKMEQWFDARDFADPHISFFQGVSWRASGTKR